MKCKSCGRDDARVVSFLENGMVFRGVFFRDSTDELICDDCWLMLRDASIWFPVQREPKP